MCGDAVGFSGRRFRRRISPDPRDPRRKAQPSSHLLLFPRYRSLSPEAAKPRRPPARRRVGRALGRVIPRTGGLNRKNRKCSQKVADAGPRTWSPLWRQRGRSREAKMVSQRLAQRVLVGGCPWAPTNTTLPMIGVITTRNRKAETLRQKPNLRYEGTP